MTTLMPKEAFASAPVVQWNHVDGPLMTWAGRGHWLTWGERIMLFFRMTDLETIAFQRFHRRRAS